MGEEGLEDEEEDQSKDSKKQAFLERAKHVTLRAARSITPIKVLETRSAAKSLCSGNETLATKNINQQLVCSRFSVCACIGTCTPRPTFSLKNPFEHALFGPRF